MVPIMVLVFQTQKNEHPSYLFDIISNALSTRTTRSHNNILLFNVKHEYLRSSFFPSTVTEWNMLYNNIRNLESVSAFKKQILKCIRLNIARKMKFSIKDFSSKFDQIHSFTGEILNGKLHFLCSEVLIARLIILMELNYLRD